MSAKRVSRMVCRWLCHTGSARASFWDVYRPGTTGVSLSDRRAASPFLKKAGRALRLLAKLSRIATDGMLGGKGSASLVEESLFHPLVQEELPVSLRAVWVG